MKNIKDFLNSFGIYSVNDLIKTIAGMFLCSFFVIIILLIWFDDNEFYSKMLVTNLVFIALFYLLDKATQDEN